MSGARRRKCLETFKMVTSIDDVRSLRFWKAAVAEFLGTSLLVFLGCGACVAWSEAYEPTVFHVAFSFGLAVATAVWGIGHVSGGHINPALTVAMLATRKISLTRASLYMVAQCLGAVTGAAILLGVAPSHYTGAFGSTTVGRGITHLQAAGIEFMVTFVLVFTVFATADDRRKDHGGSHPLSIGLSITASILASGNATGGSLNPARSLGPAVVSSTWENHWVYWVGPMFGGTVAGLLYENFFAVNASLRKVRAFLLSSDFDNDKFEAAKVKIRILEEIDEELALKNSTCSDV